MPHHQTHAGRTQGIPLSAAGVWEPLCGRVRDHYRFAWIRYYLRNRDIEAARALGYAFSRGGDYAESLAPSAATRPELIYGYWLHANGRSRSSATRNGSATTCQRRCFRPG